MKKWSKYNHLFHTERFGYFLYNALSNLLLQLDQTHFVMLEHIRDARRIIPIKSDKAFFDLLTDKGFLVLEEEENLQLMQLRYRRNVECFNTSILGLTICPTLHCNFSCSYCFENSQSKLGVMSSKTIESIISFINKCDDAKNISVTWYGGEPTLAFDVIENLTKRFLEIYPTYNNANLITNGYDLGTDKINQLEKLKITSIQITLDGCEATHNKRRMLKNGNPTYKKILENIDFLMNSSWKGNCSIRVNIDRENQNEYASLRKELLSQYSGKKLTVYAGHVNTFLASNYDCQCGLCNTEWADLTIGLYKREGIVPRGGFYPTKNSTNICVANSYYGYVIGPEGEIYKCWEDVGKNKMVIGSVHDNLSVSNLELEARYIIGTDPFDDENCKKCSIMPICGGGCVNKRMRSQQFGEESLDYCSPLKKNLTKYLEAYLDIKHNEMICAAMLGNNNSNGSMVNGYNLLHIE